MYLIEDDNVQQIHDNSRAEKYAAKGRSNVERDREYERGKEIQQCLIYLSSSACCLLDHVKLRGTYLLEHKYLRANLPPTKLPAREDIRKVVPHTIHEEEVPSLEALLEYRHLAKTATGAAAREEDCGRGLCLNKDT